MQLSMAITKEMIYIPIENKYVGLANIGLSSMYGVFQKLC